MKKTLIGVLVGVIVVAALGGAGFWLVKAGYISWNAHPNAAGGLTANAVCDTKVVDTYNKASIATYQTEDATEATVDSATLTKLKKDISANKNYENDATCQTILYGIAIIELNYKDGKAAAANIKRLHDAGVFADNNIRNTEPVFMLESGLNTLNPDAGYGTAPESANETITE